MPLPRIAPIFDTRDATSMYATLPGPVAVPIDVTTCSDEEFERWLASAPRDAGGSTGLPQMDKTMMNAWMTLSLAATAAHVEYTAAVHSQTDKSPNSMNQPCYRSGSYDDDVRGCYRALTEDDADQTQANWERAQREIGAKKDRALRLVARAESVQPKVYN